MKKALIIGLIIFIVLLIIGITAFSAWQFYPSEANQLLSKFTDFRIPEPKEGEKLAYIYNENADSDIALVIKATTGESSVVFTKKQNGKEIVDKVVIQTPDNKLGLIQVNQDGLPESFDYQDYLVEYNNYTATTVDITVTSPAGRTKTYKNTDLNLPDSSSAFLNTLIPVASAANIPEAGANRKENINSGYYPKTFGQVFNVVTCTGSIVASFFSAGTLTPLILSCGA